MKRGDLVSVVVAGDFGKPRPGLIIQSDLFVDLEATTVFLLTSKLTDLPALRITVAPSPANGLRKVSQVSIDRAMSVRNDKVGPVFGHLDDEDMVRINRAIAVFFGLG